jgi:hypothetical protein
MKLHPTVVVLAMLAGCQLQGNASVSADQTSKSESKAAAVSQSGAAAVPETPATAKDPCADERDPNFDPDRCVESNVRVDKFAGTWKITRVHVGTSGVQAFVENDPAIIGSAFLITPSEIKWTAKASSDFTADDVCKQPSAGPLPAIVEKEEGGALTASLKPFAISTRGAIHRFGCVNGGTWGPGESGGSALFIPAGDNRMVLQWYDGATLLAERSAP